MSYHLNITYKGWVITMERLRTLHKELSNRPLTSIAFKHRVCPVLDGKAVYEAVLITLENLDINYIPEVSSYSNFFLRGKMLNNKKNTRINYAKTIVMFLNYTFFEREFIERDYKEKQIKNLDKIENLTIRDGELFLQDYKIGNVGSNIDNKRKSSFQQIEKRLARFFLFLFENYHMKYLKKKDFNRETKRVVHKVQLQKFQH